MRWHLAMDTGTSLLLPWYTGETYRAKAATPFCITAVDGLHQAVLQRVIAADPS